MIWANTQACAGGQSSSSRRTWIEIDKVPVGINASNGRPPRGGRGLKYDNWEITETGVYVVLLAEDVD